MTTRGSERGMTLMEILIVITLLSLLTTGMLMAIRTGLNTMTRSNERIYTNRRVLGAQRALEQHIVNLIPVLAHCRSVGAAAGQRVPFFQGHPTTMRFVTSYSLEEATRGAARIVELQVIPGETEGVRLIVNEHLYAGPQTAGQFCFGFQEGPSGMSEPAFPPVATGPRSFVLADRLAYCRFVFREARPAPVLEIWHPRWTRRELPSAIRVELAPLDPEASPLPVLSLTVPMRVNRPPYEQFSDYF
jgi:prepilin-type N-terminal cleavage/methylation domain-containing protein